MSDEKNVNKNALINLPEIPKSIDKAVENITDRPTREIGGTLGDIIFLVFGGLGQAANKRRMKYAVELEKFQQELEESINNIPSDKRIEPNTRLAMSSLESAKYLVEEENLRKMFTRLITCSMNIDYKDYVHPMFVDIINNISSFDAQVLCLFKTHSSIPIVNYIYKTSSGSYRIIKENVITSNPNEIGFDFQLISLSLSSLEKLGLIKIQYNESLHYCDYDKFKLMSEYKDISNTEKTIFKDKEQVAVKDIQKGKCSLTPIGEQFVKICV